MDIKINKGLLFLYTLYYGISPTLSSPVSSLSIAPDKLWLPSVDSLQILGFAG